MVFRPVSFSFISLSCMVVDFHLAYFWSVRVTSNAKYEINALQREILGDYKTQSKTLLFSLFFSSSATENKISGKETTTFNCCRRLLFYKKNIRCGKVLFFM